MVRAWFGFARVGQFVHPGDRVWDVEPCRHALDGVARCLLDCSQCCVVQQNKVEPLCYAFVEATCSGPRQVLRLLYVHLQLLVELVQVPVRGRHDLAQFTQPTVVCAAVFVRRISDIPGCVQHQIPVACNCKPCAVWDAFQ